MVFQPRLLISGLLGALKLLFVTISSSAVLKFLQLIDLS